jgi:arginine deiminase
MMAGENRVAFKKTVVRLVSRETVTILCIDVQIRNVDVLDFPDREVPRGSGPPGCRA